MVVTLGNKWKWSFLVRIYRMLRLGMSDCDMCQDLGIGRQTYYSWLKKIPELAEVVAQAKKELEVGDSFPQWLYNRLSPDMQGLWNKIVAWENEPSGLARIELLLQDQGKRVRQQLFLHALCVSRFSPSAAMTKVGVSKKQLDAWVRDDYEFAELVEEIQWHKGNFFEESLVKLVSEGNPAAVIFANKTYNRARGYENQSKLSVEHSGTVMHGVLDLSELLPFLSAPARLELLGAVRKREEQEARRPGMVQDPIQQVSALISHTVDEDSA